MRLLARASPCLRSLAASQRVFAFWVPAALRGSSSACISCWSASRRSGSLSLSSSSSVLSYRRCCFFLGRLGGGSLLASGSCQNQFLPSW